MIVLVTGKVFVSLPLLPAWNFFLSFFLSKSDNLFFSDIAFYSLGFPFFLSFFFLFFRETNANIIIINEDHEVNFVFPPHLGR